MSPPRIYFKSTLFTTSSIAYELIQPNNQVSSECVCSPALFLLLCKRYYEEQILTLTLNQPRKVLSSFHIRNVGILWSFDMEGMGTDASKEVILDTPLPLFTGWL